MAAEVRCVKMSEPETDGKKKCPFSGLLQGSLAG